MHPDMARFRGAIPLLLILTAPSPPPQPALNGTLAVPLACTPGTDCFVQQYADHDPGPGAKDYRCGSQSYNGHDGTDFRLPSIAAQKRGVAVLAATGGTVLATRDGEADHLAATDADRAAIKDRECGNGVLIGQAGGWQMQYCHMARGSIAVAKGDTVMTGQKLGLVGLSGNTQFPHLHLTIRQDGRWIDPFAPERPASVCSDAASPSPLWSRKAAAALAYRGPEIINLGFTDRPATMDGIEEEALAPPHGASPAMVFYARAINLLAGDKVHVEIRDPSGTPVALNDAVLDRAKAQYMLFGGRKRPASGWTAGRYTGEIHVVRNGKVVAQRTQDIAL